MLVDLFNSCGVVAILDLVINTWEAGSGEHDASVESPYIEMGDIVLKAPNSSAGLTK